MPSRPPASVHSRWTVQCANAVYLLRSIQQPQPLIGRAERCRFQIPGFRFQMGMYAEQPIGCARHHRVLDVSCRHRPGDLPHWQILMHFFTLGTLGTNGFILCRFQGCDVEAWCGALLVSDRLAGQPLQAVGKLPSTAVCQARSTAWSSGGWVSGSRPATDWTVCPSHGGWEGAMGTTAWSPPRQGTI